MRDMRERGHGLRMIARHFQVSHQTASTWMSRPDDYTPQVRVKKDRNQNGKPYITNGKPAGSTRYSEETKQEARDMHKQGTSFDEIARHFDTTYTTVYLWCTPRAADKKKKQALKRYKRDKEYHAKRVRQSVKKRRAVRRDTLQNLELRGLTFFYKGKELATCPDEQAASVVADMMNLIGKEGFPGQRDN